METILRGYISDGSLEINQQRELIISKINENNNDQNKNSPINNNDIEDEDEDEEVNLYLK